MMLRFFSKSLLLFASLALGLSLAANSAPPSRPNIIFIMPDDLGYGDLGCYGSEKIETPHIDRLATQGTRFTSCYAGASVCAPSRGVLLTGLDTGHARIRDNSAEVGGTLESFADGREGGMRISLTAHDYTVFELLKSAGYATGATGKWGVGEPGSDGTPGKHGVDECFGYLNQNHAPYYYTDYLWRNDHKQTIPENRDRQHAVYSNDLMADFAVDFVQRHQKEPFFLYLPFTIPHDKIEVPDLGEYATKDWPEEAKIYAAMITQLDGYVGRLMAELERLGLAENTIVFFTSDNGPANHSFVDFFRSSGGMRGGKATLYEGGIRMPMIVRWPGHVPAGQTSDTPWMFADFLPTAAELAGVPAPAGIDGESVLPLLKGEAPLKESRYLYWEFPRKGLWQAVRHGPWKAIRHGIDQPLELYNLETDQNEEHNVAEQHPVIVADLADWLKTARVPSPHWPDEE